MPYRDPMRVPVVASALLALAVVLSTARSYAAARESQLWTGLFLTAKDPRDAASPWSVWLDAQARRGPSGTTALLRPALGYRFSPGFSLWAGYAWVGSFADSDETSDVVEHRAWQQALFAGSEGQLTYQFRPRLEQRFRDDETPALRARMLARANVALWPGAPLAVASWDEVFVAVGDTSWGAPSGLDQNRLFLGLAYTQGAVRIEAGYVGTTVRRKDDSLLHQHNPTLWLFFTY